MFFFRYVKFFRFRLYLFSSTFLYFPFWFFYFVLFFFPASRVTLIRYGFFIFMYVFFFCFLNVCSVAIASTTWYKSSTARLLLLRRYYRQTFATCTITSIVFICNKWMLNLWYICIHVRWFGLIRFLIISTSRCVCLFLCSSCSLFIHHRFSRNFTDSQNTSSNATQRHSILFIDWLKLYAYVIVLID